MAHSARRNPPVPAQTYRCHVESVHRQAVENARRAAAYCRGDAAAFVDAVDAAALYHDLGKLDEQNQAVLQKISRDALPVAHEDAGVEQLMRLKRMESAVLVAAHHAGLFSREDEQVKGGRTFRNLRVCDRVDGLLDLYTDTHTRAGLGAPASLPAGKPIDKCGFTRRLMLSCLVDADHGDTARHYGEEVHVSPPKTRWADRQTALDRYVDSLPRGETTRERQRNELRQRIFDACRGAPLDPAIRACDAPVGSGKTTAVMAYLLRVAQERSLRHIIVVLPYTNIIKQSVDTYRKALVLPGECPEDVVAEHHHQADFGSLELRHLATLWKSPVIVTTAVQFFETLANHDPTRLRKLHELPGSAVFVDETHAAIPSHLWPQMWRWLETWTRDWDGHLVLASGSLPRFWELREYVDPPKTPAEVPDLVPEDLRHELEATESRRIIVSPVERPLTTGELIEFVYRQPGPRLVILNTVQSAAVVASAMRKAGYDVVHLSTALAPVHRENIVEAIKERLRRKHSSTHDWTLVATSCVEAGLDFSFRTGLRESCSVSSLIQVGGRVSRQNEYDDATVWHLRVTGPDLRHHPGFQVSQRVVDAMVEDGSFARLAPAVLSKEAMRRECTEGGRQRAREILELEEKMEYPAVSDCCRVIAADTRLVIIDPDVANRLRDPKHRQHIDKTTLLRHSVQIWSHRVRALPVEPLWPGPDLQDGLCVWSAAYDPDFLGYMAGVLPLLEGIREGVFLA